MSHSFQFIQKEDPNNKNVIKQSNPTKREKRRQSIINRIPSNTGETRRDIPGRHFSPLSKLREVREYAITTHFLKEKGMMQKQKQKDRKNYRPTKQNTCIRLSVLLFYRQFVEAED